MKQYRLQSSDHLGVVQCGWGYGRKVSWSAWRTIGYYPSEDRAREAFSARNGQGLTRYRVVYGAQTVVK